MCFKVRTSTARTAVPMRLAEMSRPAPKEPPGKVSPRKAGKVPPGKALLVACSTLTRVLRPQMQVVWQGWVSYSPCLRGLPLLWAGSKGWRQIVRQ